MILDTSAYVGPYPFRHLAEHGVDDLVRHMDRLGIDRAWVGHLASPWHRDPAPANQELVRALRPLAGRLAPVPTIHPGLPRWQDDLARARDGEAPAVRVFPGAQGLTPTGSAVEALVQAAAEARLPVVLTTRFEDVRQRHPLDHTPDLEAAAVRTLARLDPQARLLVTHADAAFVEEVHFGLTPDEARRVLWEISWIWGPPDDHLARLVTTVGGNRFAFGTGMPLRLPDGPVAKLDLLDLSATARRALESGNVLEWRA
ncbi:MAG: hypothetical protein OER21_13640 [Gemmatimonadota bacterium]|nr:hypothetical protein [Gemmatimonadota bacterium]